MANQASDGKAPGSPGYQIGELDLGAAPRRSASQEMSVSTAQPAVQPTRQTGSGLQPVHKVQAGQAQTATEAQARAAQLQAQAHAVAQAQAAAQAQAVAQAQAAAAARAAAQHAQAAPAPGAPKAVAAKIAGGGQVAAFDEDSGPLPMLELDLAHGKAKPGVKGVKAAPAPANDQSGQSGFGEVNSGGDGFEDDQGGPALELADVGKRQEGGVKGGSKDAKAEVQKESQVVASLAGFDAAPGSFFACVPYAFHVATRLRVLRKDRAKAEQDTIGLEADLNTALVEAGQALMQLQTDPQLAPLRTRVAAVIDAQSKVSDADQTMSKTREQNQQAVAMLEREAAEIRQSLQPFVASEQAAALAHKKAEDEVKRALAMQRRVEIELRALTDATSVQDPARAEDLRAQLEQRRNVVSGLTVQTEQTSSALALARRELALKKGVLDSIEDRKKRLLGDAHKKEADVEQKAKAAEGGHSAALRALAESARELGLAKQFVPERLGWVEEVEGVLADARKVVGRFDRALVLYDRPSVMKGWALLGTAVATVFGGIIALILS